MQDRRGLGTDLRAATRFCWRHPLLSLTVVLTLAAGIGVNTAVFSVLNATYLKKLPIANADRFVSIDAKDGGSFTYPEYLSLRDLPGLHALIAGGRTSTTLGAPVDDGRSRQRIVIDMVTANYFDALGVGAGTRGRLFTEADGEPGRPPVVVLSDTAWRKRFGADLSAIGRTVRLHRALFTIVGVAPAGFTGTQIGYSPDIWVPLTQAPLIDGNTAMLGPASAWLGLAGVLESPDSLATVSAALDSRWKAERRDDVAVVQPHSSRPPVVHAALRKPPALDRPLLGAHSRHRLPQRIDAARHDHPGATEGTRHSIVAWRGPLAAVAAVACRTSDAGGDRGSGGRTSRVADGPWAGAAHGERVHTRRPGRVGRSECRALHVRRVARGRRGHRRHAGAQLVERQHASGAAGPDRRPHATLPIDRSVVADSLAGRARHGPPRVGRAAGEDSAAAEARHPGIRARARLVCRRILRHLRATRAGLVGLAGPTSSPSSVHAGVEAAG